MDYYVVLGVGEDADDETIRRAFRGLARRYHPDVAAASTPAEFERAREAFQRAREAYETLVDRERRRRYDRQLRASRAHPVVVEQFREAVVSRPFAKPVFASRRDPLGFRRPVLTVTRPSFFDAIVEEFFASFDDDWFWPRRRW